MTGNAEHPRLQQSFDQLEKWIYAQDWRGWDPFDGLNSPLLHWLTFGNRFLGIGFTQMVKKSPLNFRPLLGIAKGHNAKGMGLFLQSSILRYAQTREAHYLTSIDFLVRWLLEHPSQGYAGLCWGYNFPWANRDFYIQAGVPNAVATVFVGQAFLTYARHAAILPDFEETYGQALEEILTSICTFLIQDLNQLQAAQDTLCFSYTPQDNRYIHNVNILCAQLLTETHAITGNPALKAWAMKAAHYTLAHQHENGAWFYGEAPKEQFIDNIHTGYILTSLAAIQENLPIEGLSAALQRDTLIGRKRCSMRKGCQNSLPTVRAPWIHTRLPSPF